MESVAGFNNLPVEIYHLVSQNIEGRKDLAIARLAILTSRCYAIFNPILYKSVDSVALTTLALQQDARAKLTSTPHPASFVRELDLSFKIDDSKYEEEGTDTAEHVQTAKMRSDLKLFRKNFAKALDNIAKYGASDVAGGAKLRKFEFYCHYLTFPEAFGKVDLQGLASLTKLSLECEFPKANIRKCLSLLKSILGPSLQSLAMRLAFIEDAVPLEPRFFAQVLEQIGVSCTGLRKLDISIPNFRESSVDAVTEALNDISFPSLRILQITHAGGWLDDSSSVNFSQFFLRHPHLDQLLYLAPQSIPSDALSCLTKFEGTLAHCVEICRGGVRPIKRLSVVQLHGALDDDEATSLVGALQESKEVRSLSFFECLGTSDDGWRAKGLSLDVVKRIAEACPKLTHIEFHVPCYESLDRYYKEITDGLSHLEFMKLTIYRGFVTQKYGSGGIFSFSNPTGVSSSLPSSSGLLKDGEKKGCKERMVELEVERVAESLVPFLSSLKMVHLRLFGWDCCMACNTPPNWQEDFFFEVIRPSSGPVLQYSWVDC